LGGITGTQSEGIKESQEEKGKVNKVYVINFLVTQSNLIYFYLVSSEELQRRN
jgi:hypothetical protein